MVGLKLTLLTAKFLSQHAPGAPGRPTFVGGPQHALKSVQEFAVTNPEARAIICTIQYSLCIERDYSY